MPNYTQANLNSKVANMVSGSYTAAVFLIIANDAMREMLGDVDFRSSIRRAALAPNLFDDVYQYTCPSDLKSTGIIDIAPQIKRGESDNWYFVSQEEFDRSKGGSTNDLIAFSEDDMTRKLLISKPIDDNEIGIDTLDTVGDWVLFGDGTNLTVDVDNYTKGSGCINWDISSAGGTTAGIYNDSIDTFDVSKYKTNGSILVWAYISSATNLTNFIIRVGSSSSAYYYITVTTNNEGASFYAGWNLLRFDFANKATTGTPDDDACDYVALYMTKATAKVSETDYRFDNITMRLGDHYDVVYYSKYGWQSNAAVFLENATATTDYPNVDTDEYDMLGEKTAELMEQYLKNLSEADRHRTKYEAMKTRYIENNPSQRMLQTYSYYKI